MEKLDFSSCRLMVGAKDRSFFFDESVIVSDYNGLYLLQFEEEETAKEAYLYYAGKAEFVEVDTGIGTAEDAKDGADEDFWQGQDALMMHEHNDRLDYLDYMNSRIGG